MEHIDEEKQIKEVMEILKAIWSKKVSASMSTIEQYPSDIIERATSRMQGVT